MMPRSSLKLITTAQIQRVVQCQVAETLGNNNQPDIGLLALGEAFDLMERTQDRWCEAELYSIKAGLMRAYAATIDDPSLIEEADAALQMAQMAALAQGRSLTR